MSAARVLLCAIAVVAGALGASSAHAQTYPARPITLVVPFPPGGPTDVMARLVAERMGPLLGQNIVVENRPGGAGGTIGARTVASAEPNGYTLLFSPPGPLAVNFAIYKTLDYDPVKSFAPVALIGSSPQVLVVNPQLPVNSIRELIAHISANPGKISFGHPGYGTQPHILAELLKTMTGTDFNRVPYKGSAPAITDLLAGQIHFMIDTTAVFMPHIEGKTVRAITVAGPARSPQLPTVPTTIESGFPTLDATYWTGIVAPAGTPQAVIDKLNTAVNEGLKPPDVRARLEKLGAVVQSGTPKDFAAFLAAERAKWTSIVKAAGIKVQ